ncbi:MAG: TIM barrel protein, partial [Clostridia bacterium]|nr:TIM barrel protein [Clostridia bacterium]
EQERIDKTIGYIMQSAVAANNMGAKRVVVHMGAAKDITRRYAMDISKTTMERALKELDNAGLGHITLCPETMGKINQMGTLEEVLELCATDERLLPTIDFGHLNARTIGGVNTYEDYEAIIKKIIKKLGEYRGKNFHVHFSKIEFTKGGEKKHVTFENQEYGPFFEPLGKVIYDYKLTPTIICESAGTQTADALYMKKYYDSLGEEK